jgi:natural product precursor
MKKIKLSDQRFQQMNDTEISNVIGGDTVCECVCYYRNVGGSSISANSEANVAGGLKSPQITSDERITVVYDDGTREVW